MDWLLYWTITLQLLVGAFLVRYIVFLFRPNSDRNDKTKRII